MAPGPDVTRDAASDVLIVGAGAVGLTLAVALARAGKRVLVLESGARDATVAAQKLNESALVGRVHSGVHEGRARVVGGTTTLWGGQLTRFSRADFRTRGDHAAPDWCVGYEEVDRYYGVAAALLGLDIAHVHDDSLLREDAAGVQASTSSACEIFFTRWLREPNLARFFADELGGERIRLLPEMHVRDFEWDAAARRIAAVLAIDGAGATHRFTADQVVLANGTIEISHLLLLTAAKRPELPWAGNPHVGAYFQDHLDFNVGRVSNESKGSIAKLFENRIVVSRKYQPKLRLKSDFVETANTLNVACSMNFESSFAEDLALLKNAVRSIRNGRGAGLSWKTITRLGAQVNIWWPLVWRYLRHRRIMAMADRGISVLAHCEQLPLRESRIRLHASRVDKFGDPIVELDWKVDTGLQVRSLRTFVAELTEFLKSECGAVFEPADYLGEDPEKVVAQARDSFHQCGGACMARVQEAGVVDGDQRVFGTANLYVAGAATFPSSSFANPTFTAIALALRLGDKLLGNAS